MKSFIINSTLGNFEVLIDNEDYDKIKKHKWSINKQSKNYYFVESRINYKAVKLHRFILNLTDPKITVDHIDRNPLNNQKCNLRICSHAENMRNCSRRIKSKTGYRGVELNKSGKYRAYINLNYKRIHIPGNFKTAEEAAIKRDEYAIEIHGEFAVLNFPNKC